ncbi:MAG: hypothetical protein MUF81_00480 [Verrucomicrobia bacterium]|jgi:hypothetical protein|nr:hypothetical protein [Verrucomicrobiota bacterium]
MSETPKHVLIKHRRGNSRFVAGRKRLAMTLEEFWRWNVSDLVNNLTRGRLAEFIVAKALGISTDGVRSEWGSFDLTMRSGLRIEVKSSAYLQSWDQGEELSNPSFDTKKRKVWNPKTKKYRFCRPSDVYIFALLKHKRKKTVNPMNVNQWTFFVVPTSVLDVRERSQHSITPNSLTNELKCKPVDFFKLKECVRVAAGASGDKLRWWRK